MPDPGYWNAHSDRDFEDPLGLNERDDRDEPMRSYECDCCGRKVTREQIAIVTAYGIETAACDRCRGCEEDEPDHLHDAIIALTRATDTCDRWGCCAQDFVHRVAADALRRAGRDDLAARCEAAEGPGEAQELLAELEGTNG